MRLFQGGERMRGDIDDLIFGDKKTRPSER